MKYLIPHKKQEKIIQSKARFKIVRAGRRGGKTLMEVEDMCFTAIVDNDMPVFFLAPTQKQAREIIWEALKNRLSGVGIPNESLLEMRVPTKNGGNSIISVAGWENRENFRGKKAKKIVFDEVDTMRDFFMGWQEIFRPTLMDLKGGAVFIGTPKKENPNLRRLEKEAKEDKDWACFHYTSWDNPHIDRGELEKAKQELDYDTYRQEIMAEYLDNAGALFNYSSLIDVFSNAVDESNERYLIVDVADDGSDKTIFGFWQGLEEYKRIQYERMNTESIIGQIREDTRNDRIPYSHTLVDGIGVGAGVASSSLLDGIVNYKSSYQAIKTETNIVLLPNVSYLKEAPLISEYKNLRSQCVFTLADLVNNHKIASRVEGVMKERIIEELFLYQDASKGDGKRMATLKEDVKANLGRSPDHSDTWIMRMYFEIMKKILPAQSEETARVIQLQKERMSRNSARFETESNK